MACHPDRVRRNYETTTATPPAETTTVLTLPIKTFEGDVRMLLDHLEMEYTNDDMRQCMRRLRRVVGYHS